MFKRNYPLFKEQVTFCLPANFCLLTERKSDAEPEVITLDDDDDDATEDEHDAGGGVVAIHNREARARFGVWDGDRSSK